MDGCDSQPQPQPQCQPQPSPAQSSPVVPSALLLSSLHSVVLHANQLACRQRREPLLGCQRPLFFPAIPNTRHPLSPCTCSTAHGPHPSAPPCFPVPQPFACLLAVVWYGLVGVQSSSLLSCLPVSPHQFLSIADLIQLTTTTHTIATLSDKIVETSPLPYRLSLRFHLLLALPSPRPPENERRLALLTASFWARLGLPPPPGPVILAFRNLLPPATTNWSSPLVVSPPSTNCPPSRRRPSLPRAPLSPRP